jgi:hypothetical protein
MLCANLSFTRAPHATSLMMSSRAFNNSLSLPGMLVVHGGCYFCLHLGRPTYLLPSTY